MTFNETLRWVLPSNQLILTGLFWSTVAFWVSWRLNGQQRRNKLLNMAKLAMVAGAIGSYSGMLRFINDEPSVLHPLVIAVVVCGYLSIGDWLAYTATHLADDLEIWIWNRMLRRAGGTQAPSWLDGNRLAMAGVLFIFIVLAGISLLWYPAQIALEAGAQSIAESLATPSPTPPCACTSPEMTATVRPSPTHISTAIPFTATPTRVPPRTPEATPEPLRCSRFPAATWVEGGYYQTRSEFQYIRDGPGTRYAGRGTITRNAERAPIYWKMTTSEGLWLSTIKDCSAWTAGWLGVLEQNIVQW